MESLSVFLSQPYLLLIPRAIVGLLLIIGGVGKGINLREFKQIIYAYNLIPAPLVGMFSYSLPWIEMITGIALLLKVLSPFAEFIAVGLFLIFAIAVGINLLRGRREIPCGCFSGRVEKLSWLIVSRNMMLSGLALLSAGKLILVSLLLLAFYGISLLLHLWNRSKPDTAQITS